MKRPVWISLVLFFAFLLCIAIGWFGRIWYVLNEPSKLKEIRENSPDYKYINPLLLIDSPKEAPEFFALKNQINSYINSEKNNQDASSVSAYFRDLNTGRWIGINKETLYDPSSMLKVAVMMGYFNKSDTDPAVLEKQISYTAKVDPGQYYKPVNPLQTGVYSVSDLIKAMIVDSDNTALALLYNNDRPDFIDVLKTLQIPPPASTTTLDFMSPEIYSHLFRVLFNASYLSKETSEKALELLEGTTFNNGLVAGVPEGTVVAHKFGEHTTLTPENNVESRELHDCGIIYYPQHPYFLCVMTRGNDFTKLQSIISNISAIVYKKISDNNPLP